MDSSDGSWGNSGAENEVHCGGPVQEVSQGKHVVSKAGDLSWDTESFSYILANIFIIPFASLLEFVLATATWLRWDIKAVLFLIFLISKNVVGYLYFFFQFSVKFIANLVVSILFVF